MTKETSSLRRRLRATSYSVLVCAGALILALGVLLEGWSFSAPQIQLPLIALGITVLLLPRILSDRLCARVSLLLLSCGICIVLSEMLLRKFTRYPIDAHSNKLSDAELGHRVHPSYPDVDDNGFRNPSVAVQADIVTIGDSHTFGHNASTSNSWPWQLGNSTGYSVYNLGIGGYGFLQYHCLVDRALNLRPNYLIFGIYFANDLANIRMHSEKVPKARQWCIDNGFAGAFDDLPDPPDPAPWSLETVIVGKTAIGSLLKYALPGYGLTLPQGLRIKHPLNPTRISYQRLRGWAFLDLNNPQNATAFRAAQAILQQADYACRKQNCELIVLFIPSKEAVYYDYLIQQSTEIPSLYHRAVKWERNVLREMQSFLDRHQIRNCEAYSTMTQALGNEGPLYLRGANGHPVALGYRKYAEAVLTELELTSNRLTDNPDLSNIRR